MRNHHFLIIGAVAFIFTAFFILAREDPFVNIIYPIPELGNCTDKDDCAVYCDSPENAKPCLDFAEKHGLIPAEEIAMGQKMLEIGDIGGPGGCQGKAECEAYCDNPGHMEECIEFALKNDLIPPDELEEVEKVLAAIRQGHRPPACHGKAACDAYCQAPEHFEECIAFGEAAGLIPPDEIEDARKALEAVRKGIKPPACKGRAECDAYCGQPEHLEECLTFAEAAGFMTTEEAAMARRTGGKGPGNCRGKEVCEAYCEDSAHAEECINFAVENGFLSSEEAENAKKMLAAGFTGGPGGCKGKEECDAYCNDLAHMEECVNFGEKMGFMSSEDAERARRMAERGINVMQGGPGGCKGKEECEAFCNDPANRDTCMDFAVQIGEMTAEQAEQAKRGMEMMQQGGPGGCQGEEECKSYCDDPSHFEECSNFAVQQGIISPEEAQQMRERMQGPPPEGMAPEGTMPGYGPPPEGMPPEGFPPGYGPPPEGVPPEGGMMPPPTEAPQSFFQRIQIFLASLLSILREK